MNHNLRASVKYTTTWIIAADKVSFSVPFVLCAIEPLSIPLTFFFALFYISIRPRNTNTYYFRFF